MIFYQLTTDTVTKDFLTNIFFKGCPEPHILHTYFCGSPTLKTLSDFWNTIEEKRITLTNPYHHNFLCIEIQYDEKTDISTMTHFTDIAANSLNASFANDLFLFSIIYEDSNQKPHAIIIVSDIERSPNQSSTAFLSRELIMQIINDSWLDMYISKITSKSISVFNGKDGELAYDGVFHVKCDTEPCNFKNVKS